MSPQYGELQPTSGLPVWGTPANFNGCRILAVLMHGSQVVLKCNCTRLANFEDF